MTETILCGTSYLGNDSAIAHFGLGIEDSIEWVEVRFPLGDTQKRGNVSVDQRIIIKEKE
ncbi:MAG: hypothetical protein HOI66_15050 [Verrucomicrobia bacterium]|jgi:hypothetical protein|nr:hypothetical protein [Verrucomicrobiota bacterium]